VKPLAARVVGIVLTPRATFSQLCTEASPPWLDVLTLSTLVTFASSAGLLVTQVGQLALVDQFERTATAFGWRVDDRLYEQLVALSTHGLASATAIALVIGPALTFLVSLLTVVGLRFSGLGPGSLQRVLSVVAHAGVVLALKQVVTAPLDYAGETLTSPTTLGHLLVGFDEASPLARFLGLIDGFTVWWAVVLAIGIAAATRLRLRRVALCLLGVYVVIAMLLALLMSLMGGTT